MALGVQMEGFEEWRYPYHRILMMKNRVK